MFSLLRACAGSLTILAAASALPARVFAQSAPPSFHVARNFDTGWVLNSGDQASTIASFPVRLAGASWVRLVFEQIELPPVGARLRLTSVLDGAQQELDARQCLEWGGTSAYFNGEDVQVEIVAEPDSGRCRVVLSGITAGVPPMPSFSQCGPADDRVPSSDPRVGRSMPVGCTAFLIGDCGHNLLSAGHCSGPTLQLVEFNVPPSDSNGAVTHPPPADQYAVDPVSKQSSTGGLGNDWAYFGVFPNPSTGLRPYQRQQAAFALAGGAPTARGSIVVRVTSYGTDTTPAERNQTQQTATGSYLSSSGTTVGYRTDTEGGSSGAPVEWEQGDEVIGIHTHGGCDATAGMNSGTVIDHPALQAALASPQGQCECRGETSTYCTGKVNSQGCVETIYAVGTPSASGAAGPFLIHASQIVNNKLGLMFYGSAPASHPFQGGTACVGGSVRRVGVQSSGGIPGTPNCTGTFTFDMGARIASQVDVNLVVGANVFAQYYSRDPASPTGPFGLTNGLQFTIGP
ncbi:MAG: trypsin-like serine peptidase [Planctomycetota bacterium]